MVSLPSGSLKVFLPPFIAIVSAPGPPSIGKFPFVVTIVSSPGPPFIEAFPPGPANMMSLPTRHSLDRCHYY